MRDIDISCFSKKHQTVSSLRADTSAHGYVYCYSNRLV